MEDDQKEDENDLDFNDKINDNKLYLKQIDEISKSYKRKKDKIKNYFDTINKQYEESHKFYELFSNLIKDYKECKSKNIENLNNILNKYFVNDNSNKENCQVQTIKKELKEIINNQILSEKEKIKKLNNDDKINNVFNDINKSKELINNLNNLYNSYIKSIDDIQKININYLKYFNNYEVKLIDTVDKNFKDKSKNNNIILIEYNNFINNNNNANNKDKIDFNNLNINEFIYDEKEQNEFNEMIQKLKAKEKKYKELLKNYDDNINPKYQELKKCIENIDKYHNNFREKENQIFTFVYLGYIISMENESVYQKKKINFEKLNLISFQNFKELNQLFDTINFEKYNMNLISPNKDDDHICKQIPSNIIIKLSHIINYYFPYIPKLQRGDYEEPNIRFIFNLCEKIFDTKDILRKEESKIANLLKNPNYRFVFLKSLNFFRTKGKFVLKKENLIVLGNTIREIIDLYDKDKGEFEVLQLLIVISQTYYSINKKNEKIYLIRFIEDHKLFQSEELWQYYIDESINREIKEKEKNLTENDSSIDDEVMANYRKCNLYFSVLLSVTQNILEFQVNKEVIKKIMDDIIAKKYNIIPEYIEQINSLIDETKYIDKKKLDINKDILG